MTEVVFQKGTVEDKGKGFSVDTPEKHFSPLECQSYQEEIKLIQS